MSTGLSAIGVKPAIFKDQELQERFDRDGYVVMDFISPHHARYIAEKFYELHTEVPKGFYSAAFSADDAFKQDIYAHTHAVFADVVEHHFKDYKILGSTFLCKAPGDEGKVGVHQDWTVVDENRFYSATIWVPTTDVTRYNGALRVLPGSHLFFEAYRSNNIPLSYAGSEAMLWENMITVPMKAGQAFVLNHAVIHASAPNESTQERLAIAYGVVPKGAGLVYYHKEPDETGHRIEKFDMPDDFFQRYYNIGRRPLFGQSAGMFEYPVRVVSVEELKARVDRERNLRGLPVLPGAAVHTEPYRQPQSWMARLRRWFTHG